MEENDGTILTGSIYSMGHGRRSDSPLGDDHLPSSDHTKFVSNLNDEEPQAFDNPTYSNHSSPIISGDKKSDQLKISKDSIFDCEVLDDCNDEIIRYNKN